MLIVAFMLWQTAADGEVAIPSCDNRANELDIPHGEYHPRGPAEDHGGSGIWGCANIPSKIQGNKKLEKAARTVIFERHFVLHERHQISLSLLTPLNRVFRLTCPVSNWLWILWISQFYKSAVRTWRGNAVTKLTLLSVLGPWTAVGRYCRDLLQRRLDINVENSLILLEHGSSGVFTSRLWLLYPIVCNLPLICIIHQTGAFCDL